MMLNERVNLDSTVCFISTKSAKQLIQILSGYYQIISFSSKSRKLQSLLMNTGIVGQLPSKRSNLATLNDQGKQEISQREASMEISVSFNGKNQHETQQQSRKFGALHPDGHDHNYPENPMSRKQRAISSSPRGAKLEQPFASIFKSLHKISEISKQYSNQQDNHQEKEKIRVWYNIEKISSNISDHLKKFDQILYEPIEGVDMEEFLGRNHHKERYWLKGNQEKGENKMEIQDCELVIEAENMEFELKKFVSFANGDQYPRIQESSQLSQQLKLNLTEINNPRTERFSSVQTARNMNRNYQPQGSEGNLTDRSIIFQRNNIPNILAYQDGLNIKEQCIQLGQYYQIVKQRDRQCQIIENYQACRQQNEEAMKLKEEELKQLKETIQKKERQLEDEKKHHEITQDKLKDIRKQYLQVSSQIPYYIKEIESHSDTISHKQQQINNIIAQHQNQLVQLHKIINRLQGKIKENERKYEEEVYAIQQEYNEVNEENIQIKQMFVEAKEENRKVKRENDELRDKMEGIDQEMGSKQSDIIKDNNQHRVEELNQLLTQKEQRLRCYQANFQILTNKQENLEEKLEQAEIQLAQLRKQQIKYTCEIMDKQQEIRELKKNNITKRQQTSRR